MYRVSQNSNPKNNVNFENTDFIKIMQILGHPVHGILNLTSKSDSATSNYYMYRFSSIYLNFNTKFFFGILTNSKITFFQFLMLFLGHPVYEIAKSGRKIGFSALELGIIWIFNDPAKKLRSQGSIGRFFLKHSVGGISIIG